MSVSHFEEFALGDSSLHVLDPRVKVLALAGFACVVAVSQAYPTLLTAALMSAGLVGLTRLPLKRVVHRLIPVNGFILLLWLFLPFSYPGTPLWHVGPWAISREGIQYALRITLRANAIILATIALVGTTPVFQLAHALRHLRVPTKLVQILFFCYRYLTVIEEEAQRLRTAMKVRGFQPQTSWHTYKSYAYLVGMLLIRSYERSQRVYQAMLCRGFRGDFPVYRHFQMRPRDWEYLAGMLLLLGVLLALETVV